MINYLRFLNIFKKVKNTFSLKQRKFKQKINDFNALLNIKKYMFIFHSI